MHDRHALDVSKFTSHRAPIRFYECYLSVQKHSKTASLRKNAGLFGIINLYFPGVCKFYIVSILF